MTEREDWFADSEGNLTPPGEEPPRRELKPDTDEFGRDDPAVLEREARRREREARRRARGEKRAAKPRKQRAAKPRKQREAKPRKQREEGAAAGGGLLSGLRGRRQRPPEEQAPERQAPERPAPEQPAPAPAQPEAAAPPTEARPAAAQPAAGARASATRGRDALRERLSRRRGGDGGGAERPPREGGFGRRRVIAIAAVVLGILLAWFLVALFQPFHGDGGERVAVDIPAGASAGEVADLLAEQGVIDNSTLFEIRLRLAGKSGEIQAGTTLAMAEGMSYGAAIDRLTGETSEEGRLVLPEGYSREQFAPLIGEAGIDGDYLAATESFKGFDPTKYGAKNPANLEGFLFPATYDLIPDETVDDLVAEQLAAFKANLKRVDLSYAKKKGNLTPYDVLIIASMIDREVLVEKERPLVSAVIWNRLSRGEPLAIDATTRYEYNEWTKSITQEQLDKDTPYNTRLNAGLPPTPIGNPGIESIEAAAKPADVNYLFYVVKPGTCPAEHAFTSSLEEFNKLVAQYNEARAQEGNESPTC